MINRNEFTKFSAQSRIDKIFCFLYIFLIPFQDLISQNSIFGFFLSSGSVFILPYFFVVSFYIIRVSKIIRNFFLVFILFFIMSTFNSILQIAIYGDRFANTSISYKWMSISILYISSIIPFFYFFYKDFSKKYLLISFIACSLSVFIVLAIPNFETSFFHFTNNLNMRPRGFSLESSTLAITIGILGLLTAFFARKLFVKIFLIGMSGLIIFLSGSKGGLLIFCFSLILSFLPKLSSKFSITKLIIFFTMFVSAISAFLIFFTPILLRDFSRDLVFYTSTATRVTVFLSSLLIVAKNPLGVGFSGLIPNLQFTIPDIVNFLRGYTLFSNANFSEVLGYINAPSDFAIGTKTFFGDFSIYGGLPFIIAFVYFHFILLKRLSKNPDNFILSSTIIFCFLALFLSVGLFNLFFFPLAYGVACRKAFKEVF